jgi:hypothetical protein
VELLVLLAPMIPAPGEAPDSYWTHTRYSEGVQDRYDDAIALFYQDVPPELVAQALNRARIQSEARMGEPSSLRAWPGTPTRVLICRDDRLFPLHFLRHIARERLGITPDESTAGTPPRGAARTSWQTASRCTPPNKDCPVTTPAGIAAYLPKRAQESCRSPLSQPARGRRVGGVPAMMSTGYQRRPDGPRPS